MKFICADCKHESDIPGYLSIIGTKATPVLCMNCGTMNIIVAANQKDFERIWENGMRMENDWK